MNGGLTTVFEVFSFCAGACIASFLNVVIWRVPRGESIVLPGSHCPKCGAAIRWYQNVPIVSWLALRGRCAACREPISPRYVLIELLGGALFLAAFLKLWTPQAPLWVSVTHLVVLWTWIALMIVGSMIDFDHRLLPDFVTVGGMALGLAANAFSSCAAYALLPAAEALRSAAILGLDVPRFLHPVTSSVAGLGLGLGLLWTVRYLGSKAFGREAMGMGDVFLMGAVGALFGPLAVLATLILASLSGSAVGLGLMALARTRFGRFAEIPFGPCICLGCLVWMFCGRELVGWYVNLLK
ncbi:MAG: prepilin peptidase [Kiritimatiellia bacterium]